MHTIESEMARACSGVRGSVYLAVSGGADSMALMVAAARVVRAGSICVLHVNHGLHADAAVWADHVESFAHGLGVAVRVHHLSLDAGPGVEAAAREGRYAWFRTQLSAEDVLLTAHHLQDQAETGVLRLLQGRGAYGMPYQRALGDGLLRRPFLDLDASMLRAYLDEHGVGWIEDPSNVDTTLDRNFVRHEVLPVIRNRDASADARLAGAATQALVREGAGRSLLAAHDPLPRSLLPEDAAEAAVILGWWLARFDVSVPGSTLRRWWASTQSVCDVEGGRLLVDGAGIYFARALSPERFQGMVVLPHGTLEVDGVAGVLEVRFGAAGVRWEAGDREEPLGELMRRLGVRAWQRDRVPLVYAGDRLVAVCDLLVAPGVQVRWRPSDASGNFSAAG